MFIHIQPEETETIRRIPRELLFPAPGLPNGHMVLGYNDEGHCPMLVEDRCSIYEHRPQTCRSYDCRIFCATGLTANKQTQADIAQRASEWVFSYDGEASYEEHRRIRTAAEFLKRNKDLFPAGSLPAQPARLAALAIRIYAVLDMAGADSDIVQAIVNALPEHFQRGGSLNDKRDESG